MKTFGKVLIGLGTFTAGLYAGAFISAYVAEKVMDSPLDESVLRKHANTNKSKLDYLVYKKPKNWDNFEAAKKEFDDVTEDDYGDANDESEAEYYDSLNSFLNDLNELYSTGEKVRIKMKDGAVLQYVRNYDGWVLDPLLPDSKHISGIFYGDINLIDFNNYTFHEGDIILNIPFTEDASEKAKLYKWHNGEVTDIGITIDRRDENDYGDNDLVIADYKGSVKTFENLPKNAEIGDTYLVEDADNGNGCIYVFSKNGYVIPEISDGVSLNDVFNFKKDAPQEDTGTIADTTIEEFNS